MNEAEIKVGDWVRLKSPENAIYSIPMLVKECDTWSGEVTVIWFIENRSLAEKNLPIEIFELFPEELWA